MFTGKNIENVHLLAKPLTVSHTGENNANSVHRLLEGMLDMKLSDKVLEISTNGAALMVRKISGDFTKLDCNIKPNV